MRFLRDSDGTPVRVDAGGVVGSGGEAQVFAVWGDDALVAKVYHAPDPARSRKLAAMLAAPPDDPGAAEGRRSIAWPVDLLRRDVPGGAGKAGAAGEVVGFLMPRVADVHPLFTFYNPSARRELCPLSNTLYLHRTARNLAGAVRALHARGYVIGDVNESNILAGETALVTLVDTDSFQVPDPATGRVFRCAVGKPDFTPPELQGQTFAEVDRTPEHDLFGLAVLIFQLLMEGTHPFAGVYAGGGEPPPYDERIRSGWFPHGTRRVPFRPMPAAPPFSILHPTLRTLFVRCFEDGHTRPESRPDATTWQAALAEAEDALIACRVNPQHRYGTHLDACPWCARTRLLNGRDPFPSVAAVKSGTHAARPARRRPTLNDAEAATRTARAAAGASGAASAAGPTVSGSWRGASVVLPPGMTLAGARAALGMTSTGASSASGSSSGPGSSAGWSYAASVGASAPASAPNMPTVTIPKNRWAWATLFVALLAWLLPTPMGIPVALASLGLAVKALLAWRMPGGDGRRLALGGAVVACLALPVNLWGTYRLLNPPPVIAVTAGGGAVRSVAFSPNGRTILSGSARAEDMSSTRGMAAVWDTRTGGLRDTVSTYMGDASAVAFAPVGGHLAVGISSPHDPASLELWDVQRGDLTWRRTAHREAVAALAFSPDGRTLASGGYRDFVRTRSIVGELKLWDVAAGESRTAWDFRGQVFSVAFSPDGRTLAVGTGSSSRISETGRVTMLDVRTGARLWSEAAHSLACESVAFSPDGRTLATAGNDNAVRLWDAASGAALRSIETSDRWLAAVAFAPDGRTLATGSSDGEVRLWDAANGRLLRALERQNGPVSVVAFSPRSPLVLATGSNSGDLTLWRLP